MCNDDMLLQQGQQCAMQGTSGIAVSNRTWYGKARPIRITCAVPYCKGQDLSAVQHLCAVSWCKDHYLSAVQ
jgi:hypothetical protein